MKILNSGQIREADAYTIKNEPIASIDLMERAAVGLSQWIISKYSKENRFKIFAGTGNNGGDGLAVARLLSEKNYDVMVHYLNLNNKFSDDFLINKLRLEKQNRVSLVEISEPVQMPNLSNKCVCIDALFGSGLKRTLKGLPGKLVELLNNSGNEIIAIDVPSGLFGEDNFNSDDKQSIIHADYTLTIQFPKLSFFFAENEKFVGEWICIPIGLHPEFIANVKLQYSLLEESDIKPYIQKRRKFAHKGNFGHALLISGSYGKMGAAILASRACLRTGVGLLTTHIPRIGYQIIQSSIPETMVSIDSEEEYFSGISIDEKYNAVGIGPGIGLNDKTKIAFSGLISVCNKPMVFDADALNIIAENIDLLSRIPANSILTPHPKEFERLFGKTGNSYTRLQLQIEMAKKYNIIIVLKGAYTSIVWTNGMCFFNSTGNPGMATAGSGDVLTGIILSLLAQGYQPEHAANIGVFIHGLAGDKALKQQSQESLIANDIIENISKAFKSN
ncbi:MAG: NAD(P)H-hydrate dehydratase [Chlorobi bacterium]|nr:NAD(P)H-hydrate dehydratase [Chlorobiota bacterium]